MGAEASGSKSSAKDATPKGVKGEQKKSDEDSDDDDADYSEDFQDGTVDAENSKSFLGASQSPAASAGGQVTMSKEVASVKPKVEAHQASDGEDDCGDYSEDFQDATMDSKGAAGSQPPTPEGGSVGIVANKAKTCGSLAKMPEENE